MNAVLLLYSKTCIKRQKIGFQDPLSLNAGQKYCRMLLGEPLEHSAILSTFIKLPFVIKTFVLSIFECPFYTGFSVCVSLLAYDLISLPRGAMGWFVICNCGIMVKQTRFTRKKYRPPDMVRNCFNYLSNKTYVVGAQKDRLRETVLLSTQNSGFNR